MLIEVIATEIVVVIPSRGGCGGGAGAGGGGGHQNNRNDSGTACTNRNRKLQAVIIRIPETVISSVLVIRNRDSSTRIPTTQTRIQEP